MKPAWLPACMLVAATARADCPAALGEMVAARQALVTGAVEWTSQREGGPAQHFATRFASNGDQIFEHDPDDGAGAPPGVPTNRVCIRLIGRAGLWERFEGGPTASHWKDPHVQGDDGPRARRILLDPRWLGVHTGLDGGGPMARVLNQVIRSNCAAGDWTERRAGDVHEVVGRFADGSRLVWRIRPRNGWNPEYLFYQAPDGSTFQVECELSQTDGVWFPSQLQYRLNDRLVERVRVTSATFNHPGDPQSFTPADIGLEPGFNIVPQDYQVDSPHNLLFWDGGRAVTEADWRAARRRGVQPGPTLRAIEARGGLFPPAPAGRPPSAATADGPIASPTTDLPITAPTSATRKPAGLGERALSAWERYVIEFIQRYRLDAEQQQKAWAVLRDCQQRAEPLSSRLAQGLPGVEDALVRAVNAVEHQRAMLRLLRLLAPLQQIFDQNLKPRLDALLTREQRRAALPEYPAGATSP